MRKGMTIAAYTMLACMAVAAEAEARSWSRGGSVAGPRGTTTWQRSGNCAGSTCTRSRTITGPNGGSVQRDGYIDRGDGVWHRDTTAIGPNGGTWERHRGGTR
jgi:hypothetical protein